VKKIGFIGLGVMGAPMASHLSDAGFALVTTLNKSGLSLTLKDKSVVVVSTPREVASQCDVIITMLPDTPDVSKVVCGEAGLIEGIRVNSLLIDMSSISPIVTREIASSVKSKGAKFLDAPVSGGEVGAKAATLTIMVGGERASFEQALPLFKLMGKNITLIDKENGAGQVCKIANQIIVALTIEAVGEALVFASKAGCDPAVVRAALQGGFAGSRILDLHGERMIKRTFDPGFSIQLHQKDLNLALTAAQSIGVALPGTATCQQLFNSCGAAGLAQRDHSALVQAIEKMSGHAIAS